MQVDEDSSMQAAASNVDASRANDLDAFNMTEFERKLKMQTDKPQDKQKVFPRNIRIASTEQVVSESGENILYIVPNNSESIVRRFKVTDH